MNKILISIISLFALLGTEPKAHAQLNALSQGDRVRITDPRPAFR